MIGPRGNTLKDMEAKSGAKIAIRGKGSVKEGKGGSDRAMDSNLDEDLHCLIIADHETKIEKAKSLIHHIIETVCIPFNSLPHNNSRSNRQPVFRSRTTTSSAINFASSQC